MKTHENATKNLSGDTAARTLYEKLLKTIVVFGGEEKDLEVLLLDDENEGHYLLQYLCAQLAGNAGYLTFEVDYGNSEEEYAANFRTLVEMGAYQNSEDLDTVTPEHFPSGGLRGVHKRRVRLFRFCGTIPNDGCITTAELLVRIANNTGGKEQIKPFDLLTICAMNRELGINNTLVASFNNTDTWLASSHEHRVLCVGPDEDGPELFTAPLEEDTWVWDAACVFPVYCEIPEP